MNAMLEYLSASDFRIAGRISGWRPPRWLRVVMTGATRLGNGRLSAGLGLALFAGGDPWRRSLAAATVAAGLSNIAVILLKRRFRRRRPLSYSTEIFGVPCASALDFDRFSFPSGHALNAVSVATVVALAFPPAAPLVLTLAAGVSVSRVVLGHHFPSDVAAGALLGGLIGWGCFHFLAT